MYMYVVTLNYALNFCKTAVFKFISKDLKYINILKYHLKS